jgi:hypothetical protein
LKAAGTGRSAHANQVPVEQPLFAYIGQSGCQALSRCKYGRFAQILKENAVPGGERRMQRSAPHYCIARGCELWFERLDFDAF